MKISSVTNLLVRSFFIFIIAWLWISYYVRGFFAILLISAMITLAANYAVLFVSKRRSHVKTVTKQQREHMQQVILQLKFQTRAQTLALLKKALPPNVREAVNQKKFTLNPLFHIQIPTEHDIICCIKQNPKDSKIIIAAEFFPPSVALFAKSLDAKVVLLDAEAVYTQIFAPAQTFPEIKVQLKKTGARKTLREIKTMMFGRHRTKAYVMTGAVILFSSLIIRLHLYYVIAATLVFALALASHFSPNPVKNLFDA